MATTTNTPQGHPSDDSNTKRSDSGDEFAREIFLRLDPVLRMLLASTEQYKELINDTSTQEERILGFLRTQTKLLETLKDVLLSISNDRENNGNISKGLVVMAEYVVLPIILILEGRRGSSKGLRNSSSDDASQTRKILIRRSLEWKCVKSAAETLSMFVRCIERAPNSASSKETSGGSQLDGETVLPTKIVIRCLVACSVALPMDYSEEIDITESEALDKGEECTMKVLQCIASLVSLSASYERETLSTEIAKALQGALVARIVNCCTTILTSAGVSQPQTSSNGDIALCVQSLETLRSLMEHVPDVNTWRAIFPGCFAGLYRFTLSQIRLFPTSPKGAAEGLETLTRLLRLTLPRPNTSSSNNDSTLVLDKIRLLSMNQSADGVEKKSPDVVGNEQSHTIARQSALASKSNGSEKSFMREVDARLPAPLTVLISVLPVVPAPSIRIAATLFCRSILLDFGGWTSEHSKSLEIKAMECCLILVNDREARVASSARRALRDYRLFLGPSCWDNHLNGQVVPRFIDLLEELPALLSSIREFEVRTRLQLMSGYLALTLNDLDDSPRRMGCSHGGDIGKSLGADGVSSLLRKTLADLFDMDFDSVQFSPAITAATAIEDTVNVPFGHPTRYRFRYMSEETHAVARKMVKMLGRALGSKHAASFIDACFADLIEAFNTADANRSSWLHRWVGCVVVANEVLVGAYAQSIPIGTDNARKFRRRNRFLKSLASAVLPVVTNTPLWDLPTTIESVECSSNEQNQSRLFIIDLGNNSDDFASPYSARASDSSASTLRGSSLMICSLIQLVGTFAELLSNEIETFLSIILYPLFERASARNHSQVQWAAVQTLNRVANVCGLADVPEMVRKYCDYLFGAMISHVRSSVVSGGTQPTFPEPLPGIVEVVLRNSGGPQRTSVGDTNDNPSDSNTLSLQDRTNISHVMEVVRELIISYDNHVSRFARNAANQITVSSDLARMFDAAMRYLCGCYGISRDVCSLNTFPVRTKSHQPWLSLLSPFRTDDQFTTRTDDQLLTPEEGFARHHARTNEMVMEKEDSLGVAITSEEVEFANLVLARSGFFLSIPNLKVQVASCDSFVKAFEFLSFATKSSKTNDESSIRTAFFQSINESWPAICARLKEASSMVFNARSSTAVAVRSFPVQSSQVNDDFLIQVTLVSRLLDLVTALCEHAGDFMVSRFKNDVWSPVAQLLGCVVDTTTSSQVETQRLERYDGGYFRSKEAGSSGRNALLSILLEFLSRVYSSDCGKGVSEFIPIAGTLIFPLLEIDDQVRPVALKTLKCMLAIDSCGLWRALLSISGQGLPVRALDPKYKDSGPVRTTNGSTLQMNGAKELLEFVKSLPEQLLG